MTQKEEFLHPMTESEKAGLETLKTTVGDLFEKFEEKNIFYRMTHAKEFREKLKDKVTGTLRQYTANARERGDADSLQVSRECMDVWSSYIQGYTKLSSHDNYHRIIWRKTSKGKLEEFKKRVLESIDNYAYNYQRPEIRTNSKYSEKSRIPSH